MQVSSLFLILCLILFTQLVSAQERKWDQITLRVNLRPKEYYAQTISFQGIDAFKGQVTCSAACNTYIMTKAEYLKVFKKKKTNFLTRFFSKFQRRENFKSIQEGLQITRKTWTIIEDPEIFKQDPYIVFDNLSNNDVQVVAINEFTPPILSNIGK